MTIGLDIVFAACWVIFAAYWIISAKSARATQEKRAIGGFWRVLATLSVAFLFCEGFNFPIFIDPLSITLTPRSNMFRAIGAALTVAGLIIAILARRTLGRNWSTSDQAAIKEGHELITRGAYRHVRHPIYSGFLLMFLGNALFAGTVSALILFVLILFSLRVSLKREEALLTQHFPEAYPAYKKRAKALIPFIW
jgi:protein-S-isoprenylcysteine O-methyltransferase Ste14